MIYFLSRRLLTFLAPSSATTSSFLSNGNCNCICRLYRVPSSATARPFLIPHHTLTLAPSVLARQPHLPFLEGAASSAALFLLANFTSSAHLQNQLHTRSNAMANSEMPLPDFDPWAQPVTLYRQDGTNFTIGMDLFDAYRLHGARLAINYGTQIGASFMLLLVLLVISSAEKRKSFIFLINALCLTANTIRCTVFCTFVTGSLWNPYSQFSGDYSRVTKSDLATRVTADVLTLLVATLVMISLCLQVWVVCVTTMPLQRYAIMVVTSSMACIALGYKAAAVIYDIKQLLVFQTMDPYNDLLSVSYIVQAISIWLFSCVFTYKLGYAINQRRRLKMPGFGPMQIVFIMGCQTMLIPGELLHLPIFETLH